MNRHLGCALLALGLLAASAHAQDSGPNWGPVVRLTPYVGVSPNFKQAGDAVIVSSSAIDVHAYDLKYASSLPVGANLELRFWNRFGVLAGGAWAARGNGELIDTRENVSYQVAGTNFLMGKVVFVIHLLEEDPEMQWRRMNGTVFIGPARIRDEPKDPPFAPVQAAVTVDQPGLNFGAEAELPMKSRHLAFTLAFEDWMIFWDQDAYLPRIAAYVEQRTPARTVASIEPRTTHLWVLRAGLSFRF